jgi:hypothetical protein
MKQFTLTFTWNRLDKGEFPEEIFKATDANAEITINRISPVNQIITISTLIEEFENELTVAYEIGSYIHSLTVNK